MVKLTILTSILAASTLATAFSFNAWSGTGFSGSHYGPTSTVGTKYLGFNARSYRWYSPVGDGCCIRFCSGSTSTGYWCQERVNANVSPANSFNKVVIGCGSTTLTC